jgi:hypothetical protein
MGFYLSWLGAKTMRPDVAGPIRVEKDVESDFSNRFGPLFWRLFMNKNLRRQKE